MTTSVVHGHPLTMSNISFLKTITDFNNETCSHTKYPMSLINLDHHFYVLLMKYRKIRRFEKFTFKGGSREIRHSMGGGGEAKSFKRPQEGGGGQKWPKSALRSMWTAPKKLMCFSTGQSTGGGSGTGLQCQGVYLAGKSSCQPGQKEVDLICPGGPNCGGELPHGGTTRHQRPSPGYLESYRPAARQGNGSGFSQRPLRGQFLFC